MSIVGIGTDVVDIGRFRETLDRTPTLRGRLFTEGERAYADRKDDPADRLAVRFAAKEATMKALGVGLGAIRMVDIEVIRHDDGRPELVLHGSANVLAGVKGVGRWHISLSHSRTVAQAFVLAETS